MAKATFIFSTVLLTSCVLRVSAEAFLKAQRKDEVAMQEMDSIFLSELFDSKHSARIRSVEEDLRPMYAALPKSESGKLDASIVRHALHRYFVQQHGWYMKGLGPAMSTLPGTSSSSILKGRAPSYIQSLFAQYLNGEGFGLNELAVFAATLTDLVHREAVGDLHGVFGSLQYPIENSVSRKEADLAIKFWLVAYFGDKIGDNITDFHRLEYRLLRRYPTWGRVYMWAQDLRLTRDLLQQPRRSPFVEHRDNFDETSSLVQEIQHRVGLYQNIECVELKDKLLDMEYEGSGRVLLSRFYAGSLKGDFSFVEGVDYLRKLGALDETNPKRPSVMIPNYINSVANCISHSGFYSLCCIDECEGLMTQLERKLAEPRVAPERIASIVSALSSDTVAAPRNLSAPLLARLDEIAAFHDGRVPLHGRLFAQWMHHAYPRECTFPHVSGTIDPMSQDHWKGRYGYGSDATKDEMARHVSSAGDETLSMGQGEDSLPWDSVEELFGETQHSSVSFTPFVAFAALASFVVPLVRASKAVPDTMFEKHLV